MPKRIRTPEYHAKARARRANRTPEEKEAARAYQREWKAKNADRIRQQSRDWERAHPEKVKNKQLKRDFGITLDDYKRMLEAQGGVCAICGGADPGGTSKGYFHVDHNHATGRVRALLCFWCNQGLGWFREDPSRLRSAATYVEKQNAEVR